MKKGGVLQPTVTGTKDEKMLAIAMRGNVVTRVEPFYLSLLINSDSFGLYWNGPLSQGSSLFPQRPRTDTHVPHKPMRIDELSRHTTCVNSCPKA